MTDNTILQPNPLAEIEAMRAVASALESLDASSRDRVLDWAIKFYRSNVSSSASVAHGVRAAPAAPLTQPTVEMSFFDLATVFANARPGTDAEKALVAAYFLSTVNGAEEFDSFTLNSELTHLGHRVGNVTRALSALIDSRPALVVQTRKEGKTKQARKKYKITVEGRKRVEQMLSGNGRDD
jgi:hypothetical protein